MKALSQEQLDRFRHDGFLFPLPALSPAELQACQDGLARFEAFLGSPVPQAALKWRSQSYAHYPWFNDLVRHPAILDAIEDVMGPDILVWTSTFFIKEPHSPAFAAWHQDATYYGLRPYEEVCAWVALTDASVEAGCMEQLSFQGIPRQYRHSPMRLEHSINRAGQTIVEPFDDTRPVAMALPAGSFSLHHELAIHRSAPNNAAHRRVGVGLNFIPPHVKVDGPLRCKAMLVRGQDRYGHFDLIDPPKAELDEAGIATHQAVNQAYNDNYNLQVQRHEALYAAPAPAAT